MSSKQIAADEALAKILQRHEIELNDALQRQRSAAPSSQRASLKRCLENVVNEENTKAKEKKIDLTNIEKEAKKAERRAAAAGAAEKRGQSFAQGGKLVKSEKMGKKARAAAIEPKYDRKPDLTVASAWN